MAATARTTDPSRDTDAAWEQWGSLDPYYGVLTNPKFRGDEMTREARDDFFLSGALDVSHLFDTIARLGPPGFAPRRVLDFGCGVGRLLVHFAERSAEVTGVDISPSMLAEAERNCAERGLSNVVFVRSDDELSALAGPFDLVHSHIVLQHISVARGRALFVRLVELLGRGGWGAIHVTFAWDAFPDTFGQVPAPPPAPPPTWRQRVRALLSRTSRAEAELTARSKTDASPDPEMQMHFYNLSELMYVLQKVGMTSVQVELTNHGGAMGAFLIFQRPSFE